MSIARIQELELSLAREPQIATWVELWCATFRMGIAELRELGAIRESDGLMHIPAGNPYAFLAAGWHIEQHGEWDKALGLFERAHQLRPDNMMAATCRAHALARVGRLEEADALFAQVGEKYGWPARVTRLGDAPLAKIFACAPPPADASQWRWLVEPPSHPGTVVLVSLDGRYAQSYAQSFLASWKRMLGTGSASAGLHVHMHLVNADTHTREAVANLVRWAGQASLAYEDIVIPDAAYPRTMNHMEEARTWYACARLRVLPWWLARAREGVVVTDVDVEFVRSPEVLWQELGSAVAGAVRLDPRSYPLWQEWSMSLALFRTHHEGMVIARDLAAYASYFLERGDGMWGLDQAALWSVFARHGGPIGQKVGSSGKVAGLLPELVQVPGGGASLHTVLRTSVASVSEKESLAVSGEAANRTHRGRVVNMTCYTSNFEDVILQRVFADLPQGIYVDVGACIPAYDSNTYALYTKGWCGLAVEPLVVEDLLEQWQRVRPRDVFITKALGKEEGVLSFHVYDDAMQTSTGSKQSVEHWQALGYEPMRTIEVPQTTLNTLLSRYLPEDKALHLLSIDVEGMEFDVIQGMDWQKYRPWVVVLEATLPGTTIPNHESWEAWLLARGYCFALFDGANRFYVSEERKYLLERFVLPPNVWDRFQTIWQIEAEEQLTKAQTRIKELTAELENLNRR